MQVTRELVTNKKMTIANCDRYTLYERVSDNVIFMVVPTNSNMQVIYFRGDANGMGYDNVNSVSHNECVPYNGKLILQN